jgi:tRNA uridine 5-carboxymethylaminomethyl modification enzyme
MEAMKLPPDLDYRPILGLSAEAKEKLMKIRPLTIGQASRINGVRQGDIAVLIMTAKRYSEEQQ